MSPWSATLLCWWSAAVEDDIIQAQRPLAHSIEKPSPAIERQLFSLFSSRHTAKQETTAWLMNLWIPICQHKSVSVSLTRPQLLSALKSLLSAAPDPLQNGMAENCSTLHATKSSWQRARHLSFTYTVRQKGISDRSLFFCSTVKFHWL